MGVSCDNSKSMQDQPTVWVGSVGGAAKSLLFLLVAVELHGVLYWLRETVGIGSEVRATRICVV